MLNQKNIKKILPVHQPLIQHVPANTQLLSVIGNEQDEYDWIMNNFVNLRYNPYTKYDDFFRNDMWYNCYHITENKFTKGFIDNFSEDPFELVKKIIDDGYYIYMYLNKKFIKNYDKREYDIRHNVFIYGYDEEKNELYIADFFHRGIFSFETCSISEFKEAYPYTDDESEYYIYAWNRAIKKKEGYKYEFKISELIHKMEDYVKGTNMNQTGYYTFDNNDVEEVEFMHIEGGYDFIYGIDVYDAIKHDLIKNELGYRPLHLLYEHKKLMQLRLEFLLERGYLGIRNELFNQCQSLCDDLLNIRNLFLKYMMSNKLTLSNRIKLANKIEELKEVDKIFICRIIDELKRKKK